MKRAAIGPLVMLAVWLSGCLNGWSAQATAAVRPFVHPLFAEHAVLQRGVKVPVWGWSQPGARITVRFAGQEKEAVTEADGKWMVYLDALTPSPEPRPLEISSRDDAQTVLINDVLVGDVWLCAGQSNMEMGIGACNATQDIARADLPQLRLLTVPHLAALEPVAAVPCRWRRCTPETVADDGWGGFSAVAFFFGRDLHRRLGIPIGLIQSSWGGTVAEAWTSPESLQPLSDFESRLEQLAAARALQASGSNYEQVFEQWCLRNDPGTRQRWFQPDQTPEKEVAGWKTVNLPQPFEQAGLPGFDGIVWFRREFELPKGWTSKRLALGLGPVNDIDTTWLNGVRVGQMNRHDRNRIYRLPATAVKAGRNTLVIRVLDTGGAGGFTGQPEQMFVAVTGERQAERISLAGAWHMRDSASLAELPPPPPVSDAANPNACTVLYNGMIAPLLPCAIRGAIWYQGESNTDRAYQYRRLLPALIHDWRQHFGAGDFPFYIVQLPNFQPAYPQPRDSAWAELREAQALTASSVPNCGLAVTIDIGDADDMHPKNKREVGRRLALCALANTYGQKLAWSGPWFKAMTPADHGLRLTFDHTEGGLIARGSKLTGFAIAGEDRRFAWAEASIDGDDVIVSSPKIFHPVAVRYAWDDNPVCNLHNGAGLPAVPFRTDDWPGITRDRQ